MSLQKFIFAAVLLVETLSASAQMKIIPKERLDSIANPPLAAEAAYMKFENIRIQAQPLFETDAPVTYEYRLENTGTQPLTITRIVSTCSCVTATYDRMQVQPGQNGIIFLRYDPAGHPGRFERRVFVYTGENKQPSAILRLAVVVKENIKED